MPLWPGRTCRVVNDLEAPVVRRHPELAGVAGRARGAGAEAAAMTGSGSAVFGLFDGRTRARPGGAARGACARQLGGRRCAPPDADR